MECNMCKTGNMQHEFVLLDEPDESVIVHRKDEEDGYEELSKHILEHGSLPYHGYHVTHVYNCDECPNSQLEWYDERDSKAYHLAMSNQIK